MPLRTLRFRIRQDGLVEETVEGVQGQSCHELTENLEEALGHVEHVQPTTEAYLRSQNQIQLNPSEVI